ncbi:MULTISPECIES: type IV pilin protein [unclassified Shewanella]|uniref:type IV pilin protein n=1 Tax=unclassified Shewanella TaxID=196818 RepID=UPI00137C1D7A|nr:MULTISPECIES: type IV pilin protein [unclassified Shewanella]MBB1383361.1 prepilin-type N-terminal cleavage/methylation domain-containing protein [Shewanella sp. SR41-2]MBB1428272.1 prepilin-type N-terminal cleavage/methylation domain-containing protein [Shewanella sp. SG44-2]QHS14405.1 prepilin-type N-terminal cleavage/methylation domain-containing protein [Shewanella sp. Arc9-LZ]
MKVTITKAYSGFTLIEVMITVVIVGILASIAYPSYTKFVAKGARADALAGLMNVANRQEQYYLDHKTFTKNMKKLGFSVDGDGNFVVENGFYKIDATVANANRYTIEAKAIGVQATRDTECASIEITSDGVKTPSDCW